MQIRCCEHSHNSRTNSKRGMGGGGVLWTVAFPCTTYMPAKVTTAFADTLSPISFPKRVQPAAERELCLSEHPRNHLRALTLSEVAFKVADPQTLTPFYQSFCTSRPSWHCWGMFALQPGKARLLPFSNFASSMDHTVLLNFARPRSPSLCPTYRSPKNWCAHILPLQSFSPGQLSSSAFSPCLASFSSSCYASW